LDVLKEGRINYIVSISVKIFQVGWAVYAFSVKLQTTKTTFLVFLIVPLRGGVEMISLRLRMTVQSN